MGFVTRSVTATGRTATIAEMQEPFPIELFDPEGDVLITQRQLPHWSQAGAITFITWRTNDSIPAPVLQQWRGDRCRWLRAHGLDPDEPDWRTNLARLPAALREEFRRAFSDRWHEALDACHGECVLRRPELAKIVASSLHHFDNDRYLLTDFVVMPNHVHLLAAFRDQEAMLAQFESWKHYMAVQINRHLGRTGRFWEQDGFDHLVRSERWFEYYRGYIAGNPSKARLAAGESIHFSKAL